MDLWLMMETQSFQRIMFNMSLVSLVFAVGIVFVAFTYYGRTRDVYGNDAQTQFRTLLMGSWRDSLIVTLLYAAESFVYGYASFAGLSQINSKAVTGASYFFQPVIAMVIHILIFAVVIMRIILISRWLSAQKSQAGTE